MAFTLSLNLLDLKLGCPDSQSSHLSNRDINPQLGGGSFQGNGLCES